MGVLYLPYHQTIFFVFFFFQIFQFETPTVFIRLEPNCTINMLVIREFKVIIFGDLPNIIFLWHLKILLTPEHMGLEISKRWIHCYSFHLMLAKVYEAIVYNRGI